MRTAEQSSEVRRAVVAFLLGLALGALIGLLGRRSSDDDSEAGWDGGSGS